MPNDNNFIPKIEEVREIPTYQPKYTYEEAAKLKEQFIAEQKEEIKKYQIKGSPLSPEARSKVIRKWGSDYVSENREGYGPCPDGCEKSCETAVWYKGKVIYTCIGVVRFHLIIECFNWNESGGGVLATDNIEGALRHAHKLEDGYYSKVSSEVERKCATFDSWSCSTLW